jgi:hypothetical protein
MLVVNSSLKLMVYLALSFEFRYALSKLVRCKVFDDHDWHWRAEERMTKEFLGHVKVASFVQANVCHTEGENEELISA